MSDPNKKERSPLVQAVLSLDDYLTELVRLGSKISGMELKSEFDFEQAQRFLNRFAECGEGVGREIANLSVCLNEARIHAESVAQAVGEKAEEINAGKVERQKKIDDFFNLSEKVRQLNLSMSELKDLQKDNVSGDDHERLAVRLLEFEKEMSPLIEQAQVLGKDARALKMKSLQQNADSLAQTLQAARQKILIHFQQ